MVKKIGILSLLIGIFGVVVLLGFSETASARIYKWKDETGIHYTDDYYAVPPQYRPKEEPEPQPDDPLAIPFPTMKGDEEEPVEETDIGEDGGESKQEEEVSLLSDEAKGTINKAIAFLEKDVERYKTFYNLKSSRGNTTRLKETLLSTISERQQMANNLEEIDSDAAKGVAGFLKSSSSRDEELKGKKGKVGQGSSTLYNLMINPVKEEEKTKIKMAKNLKLFLEEEEKKAKELEEKKAKEKAGKEMDAPPEEK
jgi:hypothetical protein